MKLCLVVPCYNEEEALPMCADILGNKLAFLAKSGAIDADSRIIFVDDGSSDRTWELIESLNASAPELYGGIKLSRNRGHQNALYAGLMAVRDKCDAAISLDADLQDDPDAIDEMVREFTAGCDIVYGVRRSRRTDTFFKRTTAGAFYRFMRGMGVELVSNHADCRLMSRRALDALSEYGEVNLFLRGIVPQIGYKTAVVSYERRERTAGKSKYPLGKMLSFAWQGIVSVSDAPMRAVTSLGVLSTTVGIALWLSILVRALCGDSVGSAWFLAALVVTVGGLNITCCGIVGRYVAKALDEVKRRPRYFIEREL